MHQYEVPERVMGIELKAIARLNSVMRAKIPNLREPIRYDDIETWATGEHMSIADAYALGQEHERQKWQAAIDLITKKETRL